jgi:cellulose biosynthesis protein BcsQ
MDKQPTVEEKESLSMDIEFNFQDEQIDKTIELKSKKIVVIYSNKGGTGKTTTTYHLVLNLLDREKRILVIDNDQQENITGMFLPSIMMESLENRGVHTIRSLLTGNPKPIEIKPNLDFLLFDFFSEKEESSLSIPIGESFVVKNLESLSKTYNYILIDCNPAHLPFTKILLKHSNRMIYLMDLSPFSVTGLDITSRIREKPTVFIINKVNYKASVNESDPERDLLIEKEDCRRISAIKGMISKLTMYSHYILFPVFFEMDQNLETGKKIETRSLLTMENMSRPIRQKRMFSDRMSTLIDILSKSWNKNIIEEDELRSFHPVETIGNDSAKCYFMMAKHASGQSCVIFGRTNERDVGAYVHTRYNKYTSNRQVRWFYSNDPARHEGIMRAALRNLKPIGTSLEEFLSPEPLIKPIIIGLMKKFKYVD